jgi:hypothetical protein
MSWHGAGIDVVGFGAAETALVVSAAVKVPIGLEQRAGRKLAETRLDIRPGDAAMFSNIAPSDLIGDPLITEGVQKPIEYLGRVANSDGLNDIAFLNISADVIKERQRASQTADPSD